MFANRLEGSKHTVGMVRRLIQTITITYYISFDIKKQEKKYKKEQLPQRLEFLKSNQDHRKINELKV